MKSSKMIAVILVMSLSLSLATGCAQKEASATPNSMTNTPNSTSTINATTKPSSTTIINATTTQTNVILNKLGNTSANIANGGMSVIRDGWIYFMNYSDDNTLYKIKTDETGETKVCNDKAYFLNSYGDWIFYCNGSDNNKIYKMRPDGEGRAIVSDQTAQNILVADDWIYFINFTDQSQTTEYRRIYKVKTDGTGRQRVNEQESSGFTVSGDSIYYVSAADQKLYKIKVDGSGNTRISDASILSFSILDSYVYYIDSTNENNTIWRMQLDGTEAVKLSDNKAASLNPSGGWIYYGSTKADSMGLELKKMALDGTQATVINDDDPISINVHGDMMLYLAFDFSGFNTKQTLIKTDGTGRKDYILVPKPPVEGVEIYPMNMPVKGGDLTITVLTAYSTNIFENNDSGSESPILDEAYDGAYLFVNMSITNNSDREIDIGNMIGRFEGQDSTSYTIFWNLKADMTGRTKKNDIRYHLAREDYTEELVFQPRETKDVQIFDQLQDQNFPIQLTIFDSSGDKRLAAIEIMPNEAHFVTSREESLRIMEQKFSGSDIDQLGGLGYKFEGAEIEKFYYTFKVTKPGASSEEYYLVERVTGDIYIGAHDAKFPDIEAVPVKLMT